MAWSVRRRVSAAAWSTLCWAASSAAWARSSSVSARPISAVRKPLLTLISSRARFTASAGRASLQMRWPFSFQQ